MPENKPLDVFYASQAKLDIAYWLEHDKKMHSKIESLINNCVETPFSGLGKPEPLKHEWSGYWSRRINQEHRVVYKVNGNTLFIAQCRFHY